MIGIAGTRADPVMVHFAAHCLLRDIPLAVVDLGEVGARGSWSLSGPPDPTDYVDGAETVRLVELSGLFVRPIYLGTTPAEAARWQGLLDGLNVWMDETDVAVVNRPGSDQLNGYKPAHYAWLSANGLTVPESLLSRDPGQLTEFLAAGRTVVKPVCGARATTREIQVEALNRLAACDGPVLVQRLIDGDDVRVHVIADQVIACRFSSSQIDYRSDREAERSVAEIPPDLADCLVRKTADQGLTFAGWDFKVDSDGTYWCLECNPMPGYSFYDRICQGAISDALVTALGA